MKSLIRIAVCLVVLASAASLLTGCAAMVGSAVGHGLLWMQDKTLQAVGLQDTPEETGQQNRENLGKVRGTSSEGGGSLLEQYQREEERKRQEAIYGTPEAAAAPTQAKTPTPDSPSPASP